MTYIKLEDVQKIVDKYSYSVVIDLGMREQINSLPSIDFEGFSTIVNGTSSIDFEEMIKEMIEDELMCECSITRIRTLEDVLGKVKGVPPDRMNLS